MKLFKINDSVLINCENIEALEVVDQLKTRVYMQSGKTFTATFPYGVLVETLSNIEDSGKEELKKLNTIAKSATFFAG
jgi:hypothetical protein